MVKVVNGRKRKYYQTTKKGELILDKAKQQIRELVTEVIEER